MSQYGAMKKSLFEAKVRALIAYGEQPLKDMLQFMRDAYIESDKASMFRVICALNSIAELKEILQLEDKKPLKKWDQIPLIK